VLAPVHLRDLRVDPLAHPRGQAHLSAASSLVRIGGLLYVVADDEHHLGVLRIGDPQETPVHLHRLRAGDLPADAAKRKRLKLDLEALVAVPAARDWPHGALLALGSGSRPNRRQAFLFTLDAAGAVGMLPRVIDASSLYAGLQERFGDLNIEGAFIGAERLHLLQRGNQGGAGNACIEYALDEVLAWFEAMREAPAAARVTPFELGAADGIAFGFTDATMGPEGGWIFSAVAEDSADSYVDGCCVASAIGWVSAEGRMEGVETIAGAPKVEGIALAEDGRLLMVTDADDPDRASQLLAADITGRP
jgi:hypothetical protein